MHLPYSLQPHEEVLTSLHATEHGLTAAQAKERQETHGFNELPEPPPRGPVRTFIGQFASPLIVVLLGSVGVLFFRGEAVDAAIVLGVLFINACIGVVQEGKAAQALASLKDLSATAATALRDGSHEVVPDRELVPGDIVFLNEGDRVPADIRLLRVHGLSINESVLTGETSAVHKSGEMLEGVEPVEENGKLTVPLFLQANVAFKGTYVSSGTATGVVVATGTGTELGSVYSELSTSQSDVPLKRDVEKLSKQILVMVAALVAILFAHDVAKGSDIAHTVALAVSLAVSIIPEGLPIVLTYVLATGVAAMAGRKVLVKRMQAVEALGRAQVVAVDKTGTITKNELAVTSVWIDGVEYEVEADGYGPKGKILRDGRAISQSAYSNLSWLGRGAALCSGASVHPGNGGTWHVSGDPTEAALTVFAGKVGALKEELEERYVPVEDAGFDYAKKVHITVHGGKSKYVVTVAGAPEAVIALCGSVPDGVVAAQHAMADQGLRVVAVAHAITTSRPDIGKVKNVAFDGLVGMRDTLHEEVKTAVRKLAAAGIRTVMITGDHARTAAALAAEAGIFHEGDMVLSGDEIDRMGEGELALAVAQTAVYARVTPEHKLRVVKAYREAGITVAMTGDGVNDAPSIAAADLGIGMGLRGTDVAKEAADIVLLDDNLKSMVAAVEEGRAIYASIQRVVTYLFAGTCGLVLTMIAGIVLKDVAPLGPSQVIWLNFVTDVVLVLALTAEPRSENLLVRTYRHPRTLLTPSMLRRIVLMGVPAAVVTAFVFVNALPRGAEYAGTLALTTLAICHWVNAWNARSSRKSLLNPAYLLANPAMIAATAGAFTLQLSATRIPFLQDALHVVPLGAKGWLLALSMGAIVLVIEEARKAYVRFRHK